MPVSQTFAVYARGPYLSAARSASITGGRAVSMTSSYECAADHAAYPAAVALARDRSQTLVEVDLDRVSCSTGQAAYDFVSSAPVKVMICWPSSVRVAPP